MKRKTPPPYAVEHGFSVMDEKQEGLSQGLAANAPYTRAVKAESPIEKNIRVDGAIYTGDIHEGGKYRFGDGTQTAPAISFAGSPGTGLRRSAANVIKIPVNGTDVVTIDSTGIHPVAPTAIGPMTSDRLLGRDTAGSGDAEQLTVGGGVEFTGTGGVQTSAFTGDVTKAAGGTSTTIADDAVTFAKIQDFLANTIAMRNAGTTGDADDVKISALTEESAPASGDFLLMEESGGNLRKVNWSNIVAGSTDLVYVAAGANTAVNLTSDVTIVTRDVSSVGATDQLLVDGWFTILNDCGLACTYVITVDFDGLFDCEFTTGSFAPSATDIHQFYVAAVLDVRSTAESFGNFYVRHDPTAGVASGGDLTMSTGYFHGMSWGTSPTDVTGTCTVTLKVRSQRTTATQTLRLHNFTIRKMTPT